MLNSDRILAMLTNYGGRDKVIRLSYYCLVLVSDKVKDPKWAEDILALGKQLSSARLIYRQLNDLPMIKANLRHWYSKTTEDPICHSISGITTLMYLFYTPIEHIAWLSSNNILKSKDAGASWWRYTVYIWVTCLTLNIIRTIRKFKLVSARQEQRNSSKDKNDLMLDLLKDLSDLVIGINALPKGILWSQSLPRWKIGAFGIIASVIGTIKLY